MQCMMYVCLADVFLPWCSRCSESYQCAEWHWKARDGQRPVVAMGNWKLLAILGEKHMKSTCNAQMSCTCRHFMNCLSLWTVCDVTGYQYHVCSTSVPRLLGLVDKVLAVQRQTCPFLQLRHALRASSTGGLQFSSIFYDAFIAFFRRAVFFWLFSWLFCPFFVWTYFSDNSVIPYH